MPTQYFFSQEKSTDWVQKGKKKYRESNKDF